MKRREFLSGVVFGAVGATPALAQDFVASIIVQLKKQGFRSVVQERTLLGRVRLIATRKDGRREIIVNPNTGEILRDLWMPVSGGKSTVDIVDDGHGQDHDDDDDDDDDDSGHGGHGGGEGHDDDDDDDDDDDSSGEGGGGDGD